MTQRDAACVFSVEEWPQGAAIPREALRISVLPSVLKKLFACIGRSAIASRPRWWLRFDIPTRASRFVSGLVGIGRRCRPAIRRTPSQKDEKSGCNRLIHGRHPSRLRLIKRPPIRTEIGHQGKASEKIDGPAGVVLPVHRAIRVSAKPRTLLLHSGGQARRKAGNRRISCLPAGG